MTSGPCLPRCPPRDHPRPDSSGKPMGSGGNPPGPDLEAPEGSRTEPLQPPSWGPPGRLPAPLHGWPQHNSVQPCRGASPPAVLPLPGVRGHAMVFRPLPWASGWGRGLESGPLTSVPFATHPGPLWLEAPTPGLLAHSPGKHLSGPDPLLSEALTLPRQHCPTPSVPRHGDSGPSSPACSRPSSADAQPHVPLPSPLHASVTMEHHVGKPRSPRCVPPADHSHTGPLAQERPQTPHPCPEPCPPACPPPREVAGEPQSSAPRPHAHPIVSTGASVLREGGVSLLLSGRCPDRAPSVLSALL